MRVWRRIRRRRKQTEPEFIQLADIPTTEDGYYQDTRDIQPETKYIYRLRAYGRPVT